MRCSLGPGMTCEAWSCAVVEQVRPLDLGVEWEPNAPDAVLITRDLGPAVLALRAHFDDTDSRCVVLEWRGVRSARMDPPNDEAISGHRLYAKGLSQVLWAGRVYDSELIRGLEQQNRVHPRYNPASFANLNHDVVRLKECVVEVVAKQLTVRRLAGSRLDAAFLAAHT